MKKILILSLAYYPRVGGAEVAIKEITDRISDIEFHMVTMRFAAADAAEEKIGNIVVHRIGRGQGYLSKILFVPRAAFAARRLHRQERFDGAWAMMSYMLLPLMLLRVLGVRLRYALTLQEGDTYAHMFARLRILPFLPLLNKGFRQATIVQAISTYLGQWARARRYSGPLEIIPNGVDVKAFGGEPSEHSGVVLITTSRLVHKNAIDVVLRALPLVPGARFRILGTGPDEAMLRRLAAELGVADRVEFAGFVGHERLPAQLHAADIFIRPSRTEGMGNSFIEAMAAGLPVIATTEGGLSDFITPEVAWPVRTDSPEDIAAAVADILGNPAHTAAVTIQARHLALAQYDWSLIASAMREKVFARLTHRPTTEGLFA